MDWFSWLSKTGLEPSLVHEYALAFAHNELEEDDIAYFNDEFLQSMGISTAEHSLEILKLARKEKEGSPRPISRLLATVKRTKTILTKHIRTWVHREDLALILVRKRSYSSEWKRAMLNRNKKLMMAKQGRLMLTNGGPMAVFGPQDNIFSSPVVHDPSNDEKMDNGDAYGSWGVEKIRWDTMFKDLKPT